MRPETGNGGRPDTPTASGTSGRDLHLNHWAIGHGLDERGGGPLADAMKLVPPDLTRIAAAREAALGALLQREAQPSGGQGAYQGACRVHAADERDWKVIRSAPAIARTAAAGQVVAVADSPHRSRS